MGKPLVCPPRYGFGLIETRACSAADFPFAQAEARLGFLQDRLSDLSARLSEAESRHPGRPRRNWAVMVDLETMGTTPGSAIVSIGACAFDPVSGEIGELFYVAVDRASNRKFGLKEDLATVAWWMRQSPEARAVLDDPSAWDLDHSLDLFALFWRDVGAREFWAHGPGFDEALLAAAYRAGGVARHRGRPPWQFWNARCTRTIYAAAGIAPNRAKGVHHNALDDAVSQAEAVIEAYRILGLGRRPIGWTLQRAWRGAWRRISRGRP
ncbi:3'-5' exonuclease [Phenylobacterium sp.]|uniref:3'-5' exonuclease n=1 Tax=Phenylobacterium sp. TaxID=1871053 RepID=UPI00272F2FAD|nr:3'-5' exonuclease [Phenylobacterium sp.]MDP2214750.1 3'-5' exonuclease [Phenylobacterium sp.]